MFPIVYVHIGDRAAPHLTESVGQSLRASPDAPVHVVLSPNTVMAEPLAKLGAQITLSSDLKPTPEHRSFMRRVRRRLGKKRGFWRFATERFFYLEELLRKLGATRALHLESDNYIFFAVSEAAPALARLYPGMAAPFLNDRMCIPGVVYVGDVDALTALNRFIAAKVTEEAIHTRRWYVPPAMARLRMGITLHDMSLLADFRAGGGALGMLPVAPPGYTLPADMADRCRAIADYSYGFDELRMIFDGSAFGHYLHGYDPAHHDQRGTVGKDDPDSVVRASDFGFERINLKDRSIDPVVTFDGREIRVASIHNHAKARILS